MAAITTWRLSLAGFGNVVVYPGEFRYAGGLVTAGFGSDAATPFAIIDLGGGRIALASTLSDQDGKTWTYYLNSHYPVSNSNNNSGIMLWYDRDNYASTQIGSEQTFQLVNMGDANIALQATAGPLQGRYLCAMQGGWYPQQWSLGSGAFIATTVKATLQVSGPQLPILIITNSGYRLDLHSQNLGKLSLRGAQMQQCNLNGANLSQVTDLQHADFTSAQLRGAILTGLDLSSAKWHQADFTGTDLRGIARAEHADLTDAILNKVQLQGRHMAGALLEGAKLIGAVLDGAHLEGAHLAGADLTGASLAGTDLRGADLRGAVFDTCDLSSTIFDEEPRFTRGPGPRTSFVSATVPFTVLRYDWSWLNLTAATITKIPAAIGHFVADDALLPDGLNLQNADLRGASFRSTQAFEIQLQGANLAGATMTGALLKGARLDNTNLTNARLDSAYLIAQQSAQAAAAGAPADPSRLEAATATGAFLFNTILDGAHCDGVDFSGAYFVTASALGTQPASAVGAYLNYAKFNGAQTVLAVFDGAQLSAANFSGATMVGASFQDNGSVAVQLTPSSDVTHQDASVYQADIRGVNFTGANMDGLDMRGATVSTSSGTFEQSFTGYAGQKVPVAFEYGPTQLGNTTQTTQCPNGSSGPCTLPSA